MGRLGALLRPTWRSHAGPPQGHYNPCLLQSRLRREASRCFILPPEQGEVRQSRIGGGERSEPISRMIIIPYDIESQSRNADFVSIARKGNPQPSGPKAPSNLRTLRPIGPVHLKNLHARRSIRHHRIRRRPGAPLPQKNSPFGESIHKGEDSYLSLVRQRPRSQLRRKRRRCSISGVEGSSCSISRMASFSFRPERKMRRYAFFR